MMRPSTAGTTIGLGLLVAVTAFGAPVSWEQTPQFPRPPKINSPQPPPAGPDAVEKLGNGQFRVGTVRVDTTRKEVSVPGVVNDVSVLEFLANTKGGFKSYESAIETDTNAVTFNVALLLVGLDNAHAVHPPVDRGPVPPQGDAVEVVVEWNEGGHPRSVSAEELILAGTDDQTLPKASWVYTGSVLMPERKALIADMDGVLIGFMHTRSSLIDYGGRLDRQYGGYRLNTKLVRPGTPVTLIVRAKPSK